METEILTRHVQDTTKNTLMMMAGALGVTLNQLCVWIFEEAALPHEELRQAFLDRAEEVQDRKQGSITIRNRDSVPSPRTPTRPFPPEGYEDDELMAPDYHSRKRFKGWNDE